MNVFMGTMIRADSGPADNAWTVFMKRSDLNVAPRPELFVFIDTHEDRLTSSAFSLSNDVGVFDELWHNLPASRHGNSGVLTFIDGHVEIHRWRDRVTLQPVTGTLGSGPIFAHGSQDFHYVWQRTTKSKLKPDP